MLVWVIMSGYISRVCNSRHATLSAERSNYKETQNGKHGHCNIYHWYGRLCLPDVWAIKAGLYVYDGEQVQASIYNILRHIHINVYIWRCMLCILFVCFSQLSWAGAWQRWADGKHVKRAYWMFVDCLQRHA